MLHSLQEASCKCSAPRPRAYPKAQLRKTYRRTPSAAPRTHLEITGAKGGNSKPKTSVEAPDSLQSTNIAKILLAVGESEFDGVLTDRDIYLDNTPIADASGNVNFPGVKWEWRPGSVEQSYIQGIPSVENENSVNVELRSENPFARALSNTQLSAVRVRMSWARLAKQESNGDTRDYRIEYAIDIATDGGAYVEAHLGAVPAPKPLIHR